MITPDSIPVESVKGKLCPTIMLCSRQLQLIGKKAFTIFDLLTKPDMKLNKKEQLEVK